MSNILHFPTVEERALAKADQAFQSAVAESCRTTATATMLALAMDATVPAAQVAAVLWLNDICGMRAIMEEGRIVGLTMSGGSYG